MNQFRGPIRESHLPPFRSVFGTFASLVLLFVLLPMILFGYGVYHVFRENFVRYSYSNFERLLENHVELVDSKIRKFDEISQLMYSYSTGTNKGLIDFLGEAEEMSSIRKSDVILGFLGTILFSDPHIVNVTMIQTDGTFYPITRNNSQHLLEYDYTTQPWYDEIVENGRGLSILSIRNNSAYSRSDDKLIGFARNYYDISSLPRREREYSPAILLIDISPEAFVDSLDGLDIGQNGFIELRELGGKVIASKGDQSRLFENHDLHYTLPLKRADWVLELIISESDILVGFSSFLLYIILGLFLSAVAITLLVVFFSHNFSQPLRKILSGFTTVESGNLSVRLSSGGNNEFGLLADSFNRMIENLQQHIASEFGERIGRQEAELEALRSRLNPHFLANTLEVIRLAVEEGQNITANRMILSLISQLRYVLDEHGEEATLETEIEMVKEYVTLVSLMKETNIGFQVKASQHEMSRKIPRLTLQPLIENAILHGLRPRIWRGNIEVTVEDLDSYFEICIFDDGVGIPPKVLDTLNHSLELPTEPMDGIIDILGKARKFLGMLGVHRRLKVRFGESAGLKVESSPNLGTLVKIRIPHKEGSRV